MCICGCIHDTHTTTKDVWTHVHATMLVAFTFATDFAMALATAFATFAMAFATAFSPAFAPGLANMALASTLHSKSSLLDAISTSSK